MPFIKTCKNIVFNLTKYGPDIQIPPLLNGIRHYIFIKQYQVIASLVLPTSSEENKWLASLIMDPLHYL